MPVTPAEASAGFNPTAQRAGQLPTSALLPNSAWRCLFKQ